MKRRFRLLVIFAACSVWSLACGKSPPNIILIMADDLGYETIAANGGESYETPRLDDLAAAGARFEYCFAQPLCTPTRVQIMTGQYNVRNYEKFGLLPRSEITMANLLQENGYATCIAGKWQLGEAPDAPQHFGFDEALLWQHTRNGRLKVGDIRYDKRFENPLLERNGVEEAYNNGEYAPDLMVDFICDFIGENKDQPFFVYYPMILTHCPFVPTPDSEEWDPTSPGSPTYKGDAKYFGDMVTYMDGLVGRIADEVRRQGLNDNTIILFLGDNGTDRPVVSMLNGRPVAGAKGESTDAGTRVPLIVYGPSFFEPMVVEDLVDTTDFFPTICEMASLEVPRERLNLDGHSFFPQLLGKEGNPRDYVYSWYSRKGEDSDARVFARTHRYKLYRNGDFFDLEKDIDEENPLALNSLSEEEQKVKSQLQEVIADYQKFRTN